MIDDAHQAARQTLQIVQRGSVKTGNGKEIHVRADTICIHGDGHQAVEIAKAITNILRDNHVSIKSF
jgi:UPF0271 protein